MTSLRALSRGAALLLELGAQGALDLLELRVAALHERGGLAQVLLSTGGLDLTEQRRELQRPEIGRAGLEGVGRALHGARISRVERLHELADPAGGVVQEEGDELDE